MTKCKKMKKNPFAFLEKINTDRKIFVILNFQIFLIQIDNKNALFCTIFGF